MLGYHTHDAQSTNCLMRFTVFVPPGVEAGQKRAALFFLSGLGCTEENFTTKAGAYRLAAELGLIIVTPDTSPRGSGVYQNSEGDLGQGAGFYINAMQEPWREHFQMETYIAQELHTLVLAHFPAHAERIGIFGHSMGGHGALTLAQKYPDQYRSVSAFAPICAATKSPLGQNIFAHYLGNDQALWNGHDATMLLLTQGRTRHKMLIDQGTEDPFRARLHLDLFEDACRQTGQHAAIRRQEGYDHSYFFVQSFMGDHLEHHARELGKV